MRYSNFFTMSVRPCGTEFMKLVDEAPQELQDFVRSVHFDYFDGCLPNDWIYDQIDNAFSDFECHGYDLEDFQVETDVYNADLIGWLLEPFALDYCKEAADEFGGANGDIVQDAAQGQWLAKDRIYRAVAEFIKENSNASDE